ncbi:MAG TPA: cell envelope integrity protein CreD [Agriterribacter sp.]|nr:cell envelope integrity protein CreD [Agriterribacter sp.]
MNTENFWSANRLTIKGCIVACLILVMLVPTLFIMNLISERAQRQEEVTTEVNSKWAGAQTISGPLLVIPYHETTKNNEGKIIVLKKYAYFLPERLTINGELLPEIRHRSIFNIVVYRTDIKLEGEFVPLQPETLSIRREDMQLAESYICFGLSDFRGIEDQMSIRWNDSNYVFNAGVPDNSIISNGLNATVALTDKDLDQVNAFSIQLRLRGSENLSFIPVGKTTNVHFSSAWQNPSFDGSFLPVATPEVNSSGFNADWKVQHLNRNYPQSWKDEKFNVHDSRFGITLLQPVDSYAKTMRSVKYGILFIALTFGLYFFIEILQKKTVHPVQYVLVGIALCIFYTLLLSISEYLRFNIAYAIAATSTIMLISFYTKSLFHKWKIAALFGVMLTLLYSFIFILIQLQDGALLFGSIGLFILLSIVMYYSRKIDWYGQQGKTNYSIDVHQV